MQDMKKYIITAFAIFLYFISALFSIPSVHAKAEGERYACILQENTYFYTARDEQQGLFLLPQTYYVKILEDAPDYCKIEYLYDGNEVKKLVGYAKTSQLTFVDFVPQTPYLTLLFDVCYRIEENQPNSDNSLNELKITCAYYGDFYIGSKAYCYVLRGNEFGYVLKPNDLTYEKNPEYELHQKPVDAPASAEVPDESKSSPAQIAILVALCLLVPVLAGLILKPPRRPPYEQDE